MSKSSDIDQDLIKALAELVNSSDLAEIEIEKDDFRVRVTRSYETAAPQQVFAAPSAAPAAAPAPAAVANVVAAPEAKSGADDLLSNPGTLTSPMVGTVYMAAEPGADPFVTQGQQVKEGQTVLIVEAMKTMNQIPAHKSGKITQILVEDGRPIEYGEPLVVIE